MGNKSNWGTDYDGYETRYGYDRFQEDCYDNTRNRFNQNTEGFYQDSRWTDRAREYERTNQSSEYETQESDWMEKHLVAWQELICNQVFYLRKDLDKTTASSETRRDDLGAAFNDPQLNSKIEDPRTGLVRPLYTCDLSGGNAQFFCSACQIHVTGIKVLQSHINGRKHKNIMHGYKIIGE